MISLFFIFSGIASSVYIINDIADVNSGRLHPEKRMRPIASRAIGIPAAIIILVILTAISISSCFIHFGISILLLVIAYFLINLLYSFGLKHIAIIDIVIVSLGFIIRIFSGGISTGIYLSHWLVLMTFLLSVFLVLAKRRDDLLILEKSGKTMRKSLDGYNIEFVNYSMIFISSIIVVCYIMYTLSEEVVQRIKSTHFYVTSFFVLLGMLRYMQITFVENNSGSPVKILLTDPFTIVNMIAWTLTIYYFIYVQ